ncbi:lactosylceramide 4-alpha-galactosyltransferase-like [Ceratina calcarata]|uniref:Lactosylceramide 4-alpha-galactosyltransferase-like n=1 Tax=Ceratina calcarata TaxID=156304 RepID=A0AAJ7WBE4_9HYME|nr:lactosylceramide 4-alpha-galactosyltransferase-like [Ceratina calcarata]
MLKSRQGCAVESAARMNPNMTVYLLLVSRSKVPNQSTKFFDQLESYPNVRIRCVYLDKYMENTPLEKWYKRGVWKESQWPISHMSDVLRYLTLWKYGGIYLDLDVVVTKSLEDLKNFAGIQDEETVNSAVIGFDCSPLGRFMAYRCIHDLKMNFRGDSWAHNGPGVITRMLQKFCSTKKIEELTTKRCHGFEIFSPSVFYPIRYENWTMYFKDEEKERTIELMKEARVIHLWNKLSKYKEVPVESDVPYAILARRHCPRVFYNSGTIFR